MIPMMIVLGLVLGRWWKTAIVVGAVLWPLLLWRAGIYDQLSDPTITVGGGWLGLTLGAALLGAANAGVGAAVHQAVLAVVRRVRSALRRAPSPTA